MSTPNTFNRFHHWIRGANATLLLCTNHLPQWWTDTVDLHGELYYHHSPTPKSHLTIYSSPFYVPFPRRNDNNFLKHLCLLSEDVVSTFLLSQSRKFVEKGGNLNDWLDHTKNIIIDFLENSAQLSSNPLNFWCNSKIAKSYQQNTYRALALIDTKYT